MTAANVIAGQKQSAAYLVAADSAQHVWRHPSRELDCARWLRCTRGRLQVWMRLARCTVRPRRQIGRVWLHADTAGLLELCITGRGRLWQRHAQQQRHSASWFGAASSSECTQPLHLSRMLHSPHFYQPAVQRSGYTQHTQHTSPQACQQRTFYKYSRRWSVCVRAADL